MRFWISESFTEAIHSKTLIHEWTIDEWIIESFTELIWSKTPWLCGFAWYFFIGGVKINKVTLNIDSKTKLLNNIFLFNCSNKTHGSDCADIQTNSTLAHVI